MSNVTDVLLLIQTTNETAVLGAETSVTVSPTVAEIEEGDISIEEAADFGFEK